MELAVKSPSVPVVGEGYRLMEAWLTDHFAEQNMPPPIAPEPFTGGLWTTFDTRGQAVISKAFPVRNAPAWANHCSPPRTPRQGSSRARATRPVHRHRLPDRTTRARVDGLHREGEADAAVFGDEHVVIEGIVGATDDDRHGALARMRRRAEGRRR